LEQESSKHAITITESGNQADNAMRKRTAVLEKRPRFADAGSVEYLSDVHVAKSVYDVVVVDAIN